MTFVGILAGLLGSLGGDGTPEAVRPCSGLFGDPALVAENQAFREEHINFILEDEDSITIVQFHDWDEPELTSIEGIALLGTSTQGVHLDVQLNWEGCPNGTYVASVDDAIGDNGRVLAIFDGAMLFESHGDLFYLLRERARPIDWRMAWSSRFSMNPYLTRKSVPAVRSRTQKKKRKVKARPRIKRRRN